MCKHENISIIEYGTAYTNHIREMNGKWNHFSNTGDYTGIIEVKCYECDLQHRYTKRRPKWLKKRMDEYLNT